MGRFRVCRFVLAALACVGASHAHAAKQYAVQLAAFASPEEAESARAEKAATFGDVRVQLIEGGHAPYKVVMGRWDAYADAWSAQKALPAGTDSFVASWEAPEAETAVASLATENASRAASSEIGNVLELRPFDTTGLEVSASAESIARDASGSAVATGEIDGAVGQARAVVGSDDEAMRETPTAALLAKLPQLMNRRELLTVGMNAPRNPEGVAALRRFVEAHPDDPRRSAVDLRLSRRLMGRKDFAGAQAALAEVQTRGTAEEKAEAKLLGAYVTLYEKPAAESYEAFRVVANDRAVPPAKRREAMRMAAGSAHSAAKYPEALAAYRQIEETAIDAATRSEAAMQRAGLAFELVGRGKGTWDEVRALCDRAAAMEGASRQTVATAKLMHLETFVHEGNPTQGLAEANVFIAEYSDVRREWILARLWKGVCHAKLGQFAEAKPVLEGVIAEDIAKGEKFARSEPKAKAAYWLAWVGAQTGDATVRDRALGVLQSNFPDAAETVDALATLTGSPVTPAEQ